MNMRILGTAWLALLAGFVWLTCASVASAVSLQDGLAAYRGNHIAEARRTFAAVAADAAASSSDRTQAQRELGRLAWLARGDTGPIAAALVQAPHDREGCETAALAVRVLREAGRAALMIEPAAALLPACDGPGADSLNIELARAELSVAADPRVRAAALAQAAHYLSTLHGAVLRSPDACATRFSLALLQRDPAAALTAWRDFFWLTDADSPQAMPDYAGHALAIFTAGLAPNASKDDVITMLTMVSRAGFIADARQLAIDTHIADTARGDPRWRRIDALFHFDASVRAITLSVNRRLMAGQHVTTYAHDFNAAMRKLMRDAHLSGDAHAALLAAYGYYGTDVGLTSGFPSLHAGYVVQDDHMHIVQYGRGGDLRFIVVENMLANGYQSWLWDGWAAVGGWAPDAATIVQVRPAYTNGPLQELALSHPGDARTRYLARIESEQPSERAALANNAVATLSATSHRLTLQAVDQMAARVGADDAAFIAESWRATNQHSIFIHEGRHVLDKATYHDAHTLSDEELEFRAKLSELALSDYPRLPLASVSGVNVGDGTSHGNANARILTAFRDWMNAHTSEVAGFDASVPALAQLDKLSDDQIRAVARSIDPDAH